MDSESLDLMCLRALRVNGESQEVALTAASIVMHAHAIAREAPGQAHDARRIVELVRRLYATMPSRRMLSDIIEDGLAEVAPGPIDRRRAAARDRLVDRIWLLFHRGVDARA